MPAYENANADDLMFDLGLRCLRMKVAEKRKNASPEKAQKVYDICAKNGWVPISMKNDWLTVFGDGVTKKA